MYLVKVNIVKIYLAGSAYSTNITDLVIYKYGICSLVRGYLIIKFYMKSNVLDKMLV